MSLADDVEGAIATIQSAVDSLEVDVVHRAWLGQSGSGVPAYSAPVSRRAIVDKRVRNVYTAEGELVMTKAYLAFLEPIPPTTSNPPFVRANPIDPHDMFILPDGTTGPVVIAGGFVDANTLQPFFNEVYLGV